MSRAIKTDCCVITLGCVKNQVDSEIILSMLRRNGFGLVNAPEEADIIIVNTCGFISPSAAESLEMIDELIPLTEGGRKLYVVGCLVERYGTEITDSLPEIHGLFGIREQEKLLQACAEAVGKRLESESGCDRTRTEFTGPPASAYLRVADGCDNRCAYCTIPLIRGSLISRPLVEIRSEIDWLVDQGFRELNIIAQDTTAYGMDLSMTNGINQILEYIARQKERIWGRLLYTHPRHLSESTLDMLFAEKNLCDYVDMPIQHISAGLLKKMNRGVTPERVHELIDYSRAFSPPLCLRTTVITGFPGETENEFEELLDFIKQTRFDRLGVFGYCNEEGTPAFSMANPVPEEVIEERVRIIAETQKQIHMDMNRQKTGLDTAVFIEAQGSTDTHGTGRTRHDAPDADSVVIIHGETPVEGEFARVRITGYDDYDLIGEIIDRK